MAIEIILSIGVAAFIVYAIFSVACFLSMKRTGEQAAKVLAGAENNVNAVLSELKGTLENMRKITGDVSAVTEDVRRISRTVVDLEKEVRNLYGYLKDGLGAVAEANIAGLKAGVKTGVVALAKNLQRKE